MNGSHEAIYNLVRKLVEDRGVSRKVRLPTLSLLRGCAWSEPLVFVYEGDFLPGVIYPFHLVEVSCSFLPVASTTTQQCSQLVSDESCHSLTVVGVTHVVQALRLEVVGTVFSIESYQIFSRGDSQMGSSRISDFNQPIGAAVVRVITNAGESPLDVRTTAHRLMQFGEEQLEHVFFRTFTPLVGVDFERLEKKRYNCVFPSFFQGGAESGVISLSRHNSQYGNKERCSLSSISVVDFSPRPVFAIQDGDPDACCVRNDSKVSNACSASHATCEGAKMSTDLSLRWSILLSMFDQEEQHRHDVVESWARWTNGWDAVARSRVVDSIDDIITSLGGSREAAHTAAAYFDAFICVSKTVVKDPTYFTGVLLACAMLGCKEVDRFFPPIKSFLRCLRSDFRITGAEFVHYEMHVFETLDFRLHHFTTLEAVEFLLHLCSGPVALHSAKRQQRIRELRRWSCDVKGDSCRGDTTCSGDGGGGGEGRCYSDFMVWDGDDMEVATILRWKDLCRLARFFTDVMCRHTRAQGFRPTTLGLAILAVAAEKTCWSLPAPLVDILPESHRAAVGVGAGAVLDSDNHELLVRYAAMMRQRREQEESTDAATDYLGRAMKLVCDYCDEFFAGRRKVDGVLQRRYNIARHSE